METFAGAVAPYPANELNHVAQFEVLDSMTSKLTTASERATRLLLAIHSVTIAQEVGTCTPVLDRTESKRDNRSAQSQQRVANYHQKCCDQTTNPTATRGWILFMYDGQLALENKDAIIEVRELLEDILRRLDNKEHLELRENRLRDEKEKLQVDRAKLQMDMEMLKQEKKKVERVRAQLEMEKEMIQREKEEYQNPQDEHESHGKLKEQTH